MQALNKSLNLKEGPSPRMESSHFKQQEVMLTQTAVMESIVHNLS